MTAVREGRASAVSAGLLVGLPLVVAVVMLAAADGGYAPRLWLGVLLALAGVLVTLAVALRRPGMSSGLAVAAIAFGLYTAWCYTSIAWADNEAVALEGAHRTALFFLAFAVTALVPWPRRQSTVVLLAFAGGMAALGVVTVVRLYGAEAADLFVEARLGSPITYANANAALWTMAALPGIVAAEHRGLPASVRGAALATGTLGIGLALLSQSRGWLFTVPLVVLVLLAMHPSRARLLVSLVLAAAPVAAVSGSLLAIYADAGPQSGEPAPPAVFDALAGGAADALVLATVATLVIGVIAARVDRHGRLSAPASRLVALLASAGVVAALVAVPYVAWNATEGQPVRELRAAWTEFADNATSPATTETRFASLGSQRYDGWRVAVDAWSDHPLTGLGQDNFAERYLLDRRVDVEPRWVHSLPLRLLAHTGLIGVLLFVLFLVAVGVAYARAGSDRATRRLQVALAAPALVWLISGSVDWFWEVPALSLAALVLLAIGACAAGPEAPADGPLRAPARRVGLAAVGAALAAIAVPACAAAGHVERGIETTPGNAPAAVRHLERAAELDPFADRPLVLAGIAQLHRGDRIAADRAFARALARNPRNWFARLERGLLAAEAGRAPAARRQVLSARRLSPAEPVLDEVADRLRAGRRVSIDVVHAELRSRAERLSGTAAASHQEIP